MLSPTRSAVRSGLWAIIAIVAVMSTPPAARGQVTNVTADNAVQPAVQMAPDPAVQIAPGPAVQMAAEPAAAVTQPLIDIQQAIQMAVDYDPEYQQIGWLIDKARGDRFQATRLPNPTVGFGAEEIGNEGAAGLYGVFWSRNIVRNNRPAIQHQYFSLEIARMQHRYDIRGWQLMLEVARRFLTVCRLEQAIQVTQVQVAALREIYETTKQLQQAGELSQVEVTTVDIAIDTLNQRIVEFQVQREYQRRALAVPLGLTVPGVVSDEATLPETNFAWSVTVNQLMAQQPTEIDPAWLAMHPQVQVAQAEARQSCVQIDLARAQRRPDLQVGANVGHDDSTGDTFAGFRVGIPLLTRDNKSGLIAAATAEYQRQLEAIRQREMQLQAAHAVATGELARLQTRVANLRDVIIPKAEENLEQIRVAYEIGEAEFLLLRAGVERVLQAQLDLVQAEYELALADVRIATLLVDE